MKKLILYIHTDKIAGVDCSLEKMMEQMEIVDFEIENLSQEEKEEFGY